MKSIYIFYCIKNTKFQNHPHQFGFDTTLPPKMFYPVANLILIPLQFPNPFFLENIVL